MFLHLIHLKKSPIYCLKQQEPVRKLSLTQTLRVLPLTDRDPDLLPADIAAEVALSGPEEQDLHRGSAAVFHGHGSAGPQHHLVPDEPGYAVPEGTAWAEEVLTFLPRFFFINGCASA